MQSRVIIIIIAVILFGCSRSGPDARLTEIEALASAAPLQALDSLNGIDRSALSDADRHYYDFLMVKVPDKAYVTHTSDSLILTVIDYYRSHKSLGLYPEALYYAGRVYSDLGDLPTALEFFQTALDEIHDNPENLTLRLSALSQTGRLLENLRLHSQAASYIESAIEISRQHNDSVHLFYDNLLLSSLHKHNDSIKLARSYLDVALNYSKPMPKTDKAWLEVERASILLKEGKIDSALTVIRPLPESVDSLCFNQAVTIAADIYNAAGILDTAYFYARNLALSPDFNNRIAGFHILFSPELYAMIPKDSISFFVQAYGKHIDSYLDRYESQEALLQNSRYNYARHNRDREKAQKEKAVAVSERNTISVVTILLTLTLVLLFVYIKYKNIRQELRLRTCIYLVQSIYYQTKRDVSGNCIPDFHENPERAEKKPHLYIASCREILKKELLEGLYNIGGKNLPEPQVDMLLLSSPVVKKLNSMIAKNKSITYNKRKIWDEIEKVVKSSSPDFKSKLMTLTMDRLTEKDYQTALLIKCGIAPKNIALLLARSKSSVTDRRTSLTRKIFGTSADNKMLDVIILRL